MVYSKIIKFQVCLFEKTFLHLLFIVNNIYIIFILDIDFVKNLMVSLERLFIKMTILVPDDLIKFKSSKVIAKINYYIKEYEQNISDGHTLGNNCMQQPLTCNKNRVLGIENIVPKTLVKSEVNYCIQNLVQQNKQKGDAMDKSKKCMTLNSPSQKMNTELQKPNSETEVDHHLPKKPKLMSSDVLNRSTTSGILVMNL